MREKLDIILTWLFFAPILVFYKNIQPWYVKLLLIVLSPFTIALLFMLSLFIAVLGEPIASSFEIYHNFKNAEDIADVTHSYIPPCDTVSAIRYNYGVDYTAYEKFYLRKALDSKDIKLLRAACKNSKNWTETDSTFCYDDLENILNQKAKHHFDYLRFTIPKKGKIMVMEYSDY